MWSELAGTMFDCLHESMDRSYLARTDSMSEKFKQMTAKDQQDLKTIRQYAARTQHLQSQLTATRAKLVSAARDFGERNSALTAEREAMASHVAALKRRILRSRQRSQMRLSCLSGVATACKSSLAGKAGLAERILALNERCRELESDGEKVNPFYNATDDHMVAGVPLDVAAAGLERARDSERVTTAVLLGASATEAAGDGRHADTPLQGMRAIAEPSWPPSATEIVSSGQIEMLELFFRRHNKVLTEKFALEGERNRLADENRHLTALIKSALEGISFSEKVLEGGNPLLVVNGRSSVAVPESAPTTSSKVLVDAVAVARTNMRVSKPLNR
jgi:dynein regulatory complex subunit 2